MEASELRIGNFIKTKVKNHLKGILEDNILKASIDELDICQNFTTTNGYYPIELSEEWLVRFKFKKSKMDIRIWSCGSLKIKEHTNGYKFKYIESITYIKYVHQLQNLYFALNKTELEYNQKLYKQ